MSRASTPTLLALDRYAAILGITPAHFNQGVSDTVFPLTNRCSDVWYQHSWQAMDSVSREDLALEIANAERDIAEAIGWWPAPTWIAQDVGKFPQYHRPDFFGLGGVDVRGKLKGIKAAYGKVIEPGQRATAEVDLANVPVFTDGDGDGFNETVTVTAATALTNECEIKVYFAGHNAEPEWEIRPARTKAVAGGTFTATFWAWQFVDPDAWEEIPTADFAAVDLDAAVYVGTVDVYREYNDPTATSAAFYWERQPNLSTNCSLCGGTGCEACELNYQEGCAHIRDPERGVLAAVPASYDATEAQWVQQAWTVCRDPDMIKLYYWCGDLSWLNLGGRRSDALSDWWAQTIAMLATARLERPFCHCGNATALAKQWRTDLALAGEQSYTVPYDLLDNPFGTRRGEVDAWRRVHRLVPGRLKGATAV